MGISRARDRTLVPAKSSSPGGQTAGVEGFFRTASLDGRLIGGYAVHDFAQWFGGRAVPMGGIAAVAVVPEARGGGIAAEMMTACLRDLRDAGLPHQGRRQPLAGCRDRPLLNDELQRLEKQSLNSRLSTLDRSSF